MFESNTINVQTVTVTQQIAKTLLGQNLHNRKISNNNLSKVKHALLRGEWKLNGEAIKIAKDGAVLDGQHRLAAVAETGIPIETILITGLDNEVQETMDTGKSRTLADVLALRGYTSTSSLAATLAGIIRSEEYSLRQSVQVSSKEPVSNAQAIARLEAEPDIEQIAIDTKKLGRIGLPGRIASILYYRFAQIDAEDAQFFFDRLYTGESMERGYPILTLRNTLLSSKDGKGEKSASYLMAVTIKAWNKFRAGETASIIRFTIGGATPEKFPEPR